ncbi:Serine protease trypsin-like protein [Phytophthora megakarya]|uniref:Serine protease trypsin-like protein n=1 Tax=Phytophthora megakarya TaxID=4795 RepID=A0A225WJD3_9STRA|nr:Serine protease trypsin-like protein [Phytophthora megakarya]
MKIASIVATSIALGSVSASVDNAHVERVLILGGEIVPSGAKTYTTGIRSTADGNSFCGGVLITPSYVLTTAVCTAFDEIGYVSVGTHYINGTLDGEQIKVMTSQNHTNYNHTSASFDFALLKLEKPSKFTPVKLPAADNSDIVPGMWSKAMGWGETSWPNGTDSYELRSVGLEVWDNQECAPLFAVDDTMVCAGGVAGKDSCSTDMGGPLIKEKAKGDADDILIGLSNWGRGCGQEGYPAVYSRVSSGLAWINSVINGQ